MFLKKINVRLIAISSVFMIVFILANSIFIETALNKSIEDTCDVYYSQISRSLKDEFDILKNVTQKLVHDETIISILDENRRIEDLSVEASNAILYEINTFECVLELATFAKNTSIVSLPGKYLFTKGVIQNDFDISKKLWFTEESIKYKDVAFISDIHKDFVTGLDSISIVSYIYSDSDELLGAVIMDIFVQDLLEYCEESFNIGNLKTYISKYEEVIDYSDIKNHTKKYYSLKDIIDKLFNDEVNNITKGKFKKGYYVLKDKNDILENGNYIYYIFDKNSIKYSGNIEKSMDIIMTLLVILGLIVSVSLGLSIKFAFRPALKSIEKLKNILVYLDQDIDVFKDKNQFKQLEIISDSLGKCFDDKVQSLIYYDDLTNLPNRKQLKIICSELIKRQSQFALIFVDLNKFKTVNDVHGHSAGDQLLIKFGNDMQEALGDRGIVTRYSGDEFIIVYKNFKSNSELVDYFDKNILPKFKTPIEINTDNKIIVDFSIGVAVYPRNGLNVDELINKSDFMMYRNKKDNANKEIAFFNDDIYRDMLYIENIKNELKYAIDRKELSLVYQPIFDGNSKVQKVEVLMRWNSPKLGFIPPSKFIKYAEESRDIISIGYWIIEEVCKYISSNNIDIVFSINVSPVQIADIEFTSNVEKIIRKYGIDFNRFCFEITESVILEDNEIVCRNLQLLKKMGSTLALDDFGTGYASFNYLKKYELDILKIDKMFLDYELDEHFEIIKNIKNICNVLNIKVVIEGVETKEQFDKLKKIKCDLYQGYYLSRPLTNEDFKKLMDDSL